MGIFLFKAQGMSELPHLHFGTAGVRALMGEGPDKLNLNSIARITQGLACYLKKITPKEKKLRVVVGYDSRNHSKAFAVETAKVLALNGISSFLFSDMRPTPLISFACCYLQADMAVMITASHNSKEYNGYKVYWKDGGQLTPPHDEGIMKEVHNIPYEQKVERASFPHPLISLIGEEIDEAYLNAIAPLQLFKEDDAREGKNLKIAYSALHGTGITLVPKALKSWGFHSIFSSFAQNIPDGNFPTVKFPNPEFPEALQMGIDHMIQNRCDILIVTDPDADRLGVVVLQKGKPFLFNGNQMGALCLDFLLHHKKREKNSPAVISTVVTTRLLKALSQKHHAHYEDVLTGFKNIASKIRELKSTHPPLTFLFGAEESYGYLYGEQSHDKDAVILSCLIAEMALHAKRQNKTLIDCLYALYQEYGVYYETQKTFNFSSDNPDAVVLLMNGARKHPLKKIGDIPVLIYQDFQEQKAYHFPDRTQTTLSLPATDMIAYVLEDGTILMLRPSGTEPKVKLYGATKVTSFKTVEEGLDLAKKKLESHIASFQKALKA